MPKLQELQQKIGSLDGRDYGAYQSLLGEYQYPLFKLFIQQIPKDPYAPSHTGVYRVQVRRDDSRIVSQDITSRPREVAFRDFLAREFYSNSRQISGTVRGTGLSGIITIDEPGQVILDRSSVVVLNDCIEIRCFVGLPANGRIIDAALAQTMLLEDLPGIVEQSLTRDKVDTNALEKHISVMEDAEHLRARIDSLGLVAFIADGAVLPRRSGTSDLPMAQEQVIPFASPPALAVELDLPHAGRVRGMGIARGITLITGGGHHGKSTLLNTIEDGIYNHVPGDGREQCVSVLRATKVRAYSSRYVTNTDISPFIRNLPYGKDTSSFSTDNASGSTSQAANIVEVIEAGADVLLMDEDTCATNFMIRDAKMQQLVSRDNEPITCFIDRARDLVSQKNISTVLVLGGIGDYFDIADCVIQMVDYQAQDVTEEARRIVTQTSGGRIPEGDDSPIRFRARVPLVESISPLNRYGKFRVSAKEVHRLQFGDQEIDLTDIEQLKELSQTKALGFAIAYAKKYMDGINTLSEVVDKVDQDIRMQGLDILSERINGNFATFRKIELASAMNRLRGFKAVLQ